MGALSAGGRCGRTHVLKHVVAVTAVALAMASCTDRSYQTAAMQASEGGDQKTAIDLAKKEVARFSDQCSLTTSLNCGTLCAGLRHPGRVPDTQRRQGGRGTQL